MVPAGSQIMTVYLTLVWSGPMAAIGVDLASFDQSGMDGAVIPADSALGAESTATGI